MLLNPQPLNFVIWFPANFFYPEVVNLWKPVMKRLFLPFVTLEDMFNAQITGISFPSITSNNVTQLSENYQITKRPGKLLDLMMSKNLTITIKLTESYMTYFMCRLQFDLYLKIGEKYKDLYMPPINVTILDEGGFENITYTYYLLTPNTLSDFDLSYAARPGSFTTFTWGFSYNYFDIYYRDENGDRKKYNLDPEDGMLPRNPGLIDGEAKPNMISKLNSLNNIRKTKNSMF